MKHVCVNPTKSGYFKTLHFPFKTTKDKVHISRGIAVMLIFLLLKEGEFLQKYEQWIDRGQ